MSQYFDTSRQLPPQTLSFPVSRLVPSFPGSCLAPSFPGSCLGTHCLGGSASRKRRSTEGSACRAHNSSYPQALSAKLMVACRHLLQIAALIVALTNTSSAADPTAEIVVSNAILKTIESTVIPSQVAGIISGLSAKEGMTVSEGQVLGKIRDDAIRLELARLKTAIVVAKKKTRERH